ncbi:hypothetical protein TNCV_4144891 [Trichonephila clavipes]|nr:hypothetical protein TNCV_4144891 [Trichonephila clavipes]
MCHCLKTIAAIAAPPNMDIKGEGELNAGTYQRIGSVYGEHCLDRTIGAKGFVKDDKRYQISIQCRPKRLS